MSDKMREEFEAWIAKSLEGFTPQVIATKLWRSSEDAEYVYCGSEWLAWQAATEAAARRCVELCEFIAVDRIGPAALCSQSIAREFGLTEKPHG